MGKMIRCEWNRMINSKSFWLAEGMAVLFVIIDFVQNIIWYINEINLYTVFEKWISIRETTYGAMLFHWMLPIFVSMAYSWTYGNEKRGKYASQMIVRTSKKQYFCAKLVVSFLSGVIIVGSALILDFMLLSMVFPAQYPLPNDLVTGIWAGNFCSKLYYSNPICFCLLWLCIDCIWAGIIAVLGMAIGQLVKKMVFMYAAMILLFSFQELIAFVIAGKVARTSVQFAWRKLLFADNYSDNPGYTIVIGMLSVVVVSLVIFSVKNKGEHIG